MTQAQMTEWAQNAYPEIELDEPTEEDWDRHAIAQLEELNLDRFAAQPENEISVCRW
jgi:hypothetical protein